MARKSKKNAAKKISIQDLDAKKGAAKGGALNAYSVMADGSVRTISSINFTEPGATTFQKG
jgi:hypothetical protein